MIASSTSYDTTNALYNNNNLLYWNGTQLLTGSLNWTFAQNFGTSTLTTSSTYPLWLKSAFYASSTANISGTTTLGSDLLVAGDSTLSGALLAMGSSTLSATTSVGNTLSVARGIVVASSTPYSTTQALYAEATSLYWNGDRVLTGLASGLITGGGSSTLKNITDNVGIGTSTPSKVLTVRASNVGDGLYLNGPAPAFILKGDNATNSFILTTPSSAGGWLSDSAVGDTIFASGDLTKKLLFAANLANGVNSSNMAITNTGVGIGTTSPSSRFVVSNGSSGASAHSASVGVFENSGANYLSLLSPNAYESGLIFSNVTSNVAGGIFYNPASVVNGFDFRVNGNLTKMVISSSGNVGIGTSTPTNLLHVSGADPYITADAITGNPGFKFLRVGSESWRIDALSDNRMRFYSSSTGEVMSLTQGGSLGIGTDSPVTNAALSLLSTDSQIAFQNASKVTKAYIGTNGVFGSAGTDDLRIRSDSSNILFGFAGVESVRFTSAGNVGIGTTTPTSKLDVNGQLTLANDGGWSTGGLRFRSASGASDASIVQGTDGYLHFRSPANDGAKGYAWWNGGAAAVNMIFTNSGNLGIGTSTPTNKLHMEGSDALIRLRDTDATAGKYWTTGPDDSSSFVIVNQSGTGVFVADGGIAWGATSDERLKTNVVSLNNDLEKIIGLRPVSYNWKDARNASKINLGFLAQEMQSLYPEFVVNAGTTTIQNSDGSETVITDTLGIEYAGLVVPAISAVRELAGMVFGTSPDVVMLANGMFPDGLSPALASLASTTATTIDSAGQKTFVGKFFDRMTAWFADTTNGIGNLFANRVRTKELCVGDAADGGETCITKSQLDASLGGQIHIGTLSSSTANLESIITVDQFGSVGIATTTPNSASSTTKLSVGGDIAATGFVNYSTQDSKENITYLNDASFTDILSKLASTTIATYTYKNDENKATRLGLIAEQAPSEVLSTDGKGVDLYKMTTFLMGAVKGLQNKIGSADVGKDVATGVITMDKLSVTELAVSGSLSVSGHTSFGKDTVGIAEIRTGEMSVNVTFDRPYAYQPIVQLTPRAIIAGGYRVGSEGKGGFTIYLSQPQDATVTFAWTAFGAITVSEPVTPVTPPTVATPPVTTPPVTTPPVTTTPPTVTASTTPPVVTVSTTPPVVTVSTTPPVVTTPPPVVTPPAETTTTTVSST
jgi:hypothetical protein